VLKIEVIRAVDAQAEWNGSDLWVKENRDPDGRFRILSIPFRGFSRGFGEFMEKSWALAEPAEWICWMPADIECNMEDMLKACESAPSEFWALSLSADSPVSHHHTRRMGSGWREVPLVDLAPVYSWAMAVEASRHFHESKSGWGLDLIFAEMNRKRTGHCAHVCDDYEMRHTKELESQGWVIEGLSPMQEMEQIKRRHGI